VLLNCGENTTSLLEKLNPAHDASARRAPPMDLRTYGIGAQILRDMGVAKMKLLGSPRRMPSMVGYGLEVIGFIAADASQGTDR
jgi:3,4-dihydroxy 2-butanone 4-phosphate synthase/GTP cyclohydrolase II